MNFKSYLKTKIFYVRLLSVLTLVMACVPFCNPIQVYDDTKLGSLVTVMGDMGEVIKYFSTKIPSFYAFSNAIFILSIVMYVGLIGLLFGFLLTLSHDKSYKQNGITAIMYSSALLFLVFAFLGILYLNINLQMYAYGNVAVYRKLLIVLRIPVFLYVFALLSLALTILSASLNGFSFSAIQYKLESYFSHRFKGGVHIPYNKVTRKMAIETITPAKFMVYPLSQHVGADCKSLVNVGDKVLLGQKIADSDADICAPIHSAVSGTVVSIGAYAHPTLNTANAIVIENDYEDKSEHFVGNDYKQLANDQLLQIIRDAGVTGMGGASFPTHAKIRAALNDKIDTIIINAAESEPYLSSDNRLILENTDELIQGIKILRKIFGLKHAYIGIESNKPKAIKKLDKATRRTHIKVMVLHSKYPQGGEKQLVKAVCNREIAPGNLPSSVGCAIFNVETVIAIYRAVALGIPITKRIVTVAGNGVEKAGNYNVRLGTPFEHVLNACGLLQTTQKIIMGGPMMGVCQKSTEPPVIKTTTALLCFLESQNDVASEQECIRCGACIGECPMQLAPNYISIYARHGDFEMCQKLGAAYCIQCGCCSYTCPSKIPLTQHLRLAKQSVIQLNKKEDNKND